MNGIGALGASLRHALHPLDLPPSGPPWNLQELDGLLAPGGDLRQAAVLVGLIAHPSAPPTVLLTRRTDALRHHAGQVSFPGGRIEPWDAGPAAAALREASEEVGLPAQLVEPLGYLDPLLTLTGFRVLPVVAWIAPGFVPRADPSEVAEVFEVPLEVLLDPARLERIEIALGGRPRHVLQYRYEQQRIWGATASILFNLRERLALAPNGRT